MLSLPVAPRPRSVLQFAALVVASASLVAFGGDRSAPHPADDTGGVADAVEASETTFSASSTDDEPGDDEPGDDGTADDDDTNAGSPDDSPGTLTGAPDGGKRKRPRGGCPSNMARVRDYCIDRYEAPNRRGAHPLTMQSANDAFGWCTDHDKRLCTEDEWISACEGDERRQYPYGTSHVDGRCNDDKPWQKVDEATLAKWPSPEAKEHAKALYQATPSGSKRKCVSEAGVRDMTGNVEEWVQRTREHANAWQYLLVGCYWSGCYGGNKPTCHSTNDAHGPEFRFYETGFRCCRDVKTRSKK